MKVGDRVRLHGGALSGSDYGESGVITRFTVIHREVYTDRGLRTISEKYVTVKTDKHGEYREVLPSQIAYSSTSS